MKQQNIEVAHRKRVDAWFSNHYEELENYALAVLRTQKLDGAYDPREILSDNLYETLLEKAYGEGWLDDLSILKQSKVRIKGWIKDKRRDSDEIVNTEEWASFDEIYDRHLEDGTELPEAFTMPEPEEQVYSDALYHNVIPVALEHCKDSPLDTQLVETAFAGRTMKSVIQEHGIAKSTLYDRRQRILKEIGLILDDMGLV